MTVQLNQLFEVFPRDPTCLMPLGIYADGAVFAQGLSAAGDSLQEQTIACFESMRQLVEGAGASLDNVGRVTCYVLQAEDRDTIYALWDALFPIPADRPAFKVLTGPLPTGERIRLDVVAIPGARRKRVDIPNVEARDPTVVIGDWLFTSRLHGISAQTGLSVGGLKPQLATAIANARHLTELSGESGLELVQLTTFGQGGAYRAGAQAGLDEAGADVGAAAINVLQSWVRPGTDAMVEAVALTRDNGHDFRELYLSSQTFNQAAGLKFGRLVFAGALAPIDPVSGQLAGEGIESQLRAVLANMDRLLAVAGCSRGEVSRVSFYLRDLEDRPILNSVWQEWYPDPQDRPPHTYLPASLPEGQHVSLQVIALAGSKRRVLFVPSVEHGDPMSLGAVNDNLLVSSRIFGSATSSRDDSPEQHSARCFETAAALLTGAGADMRALKQLTIYASSPEFRSAVEQQMPVGCNARLEFLVTDLGRRVLLPRLQLLALV